jgi:hypothetical protein
MTLARKSLAVEHWGSERAFLRACRELEVNSARAEHNAAVERLRKARRECTGEPDCDCTDLASALEGLARNRLLFAEQRLKEL